MTRFVILAVPRAGSNLLCTLLNSHPEVLCHHEVFNPRGIFYALTHRDGSFSVGSLAERQRDPLGFLERLWDAHVDHGCVGFKMTRGQEETVLWKVISDATVKKIVLRRRNRIKTYVSERIAVNDGKWEVYQLDEAIPPPDPVRVELPALLHHVKVNERFYSDILALLADDEQSFVTTFYEELVASSEQQRILKFLEQRSSGVRLEPRSVKQNSRDLRDLIANFDELADAVRHTEFEAELYELEN